MTEISLFPLPEGFPDGCWVETRYPLTEDQKNGDRDAWPWLPGWIAEQCGPDEWQVCVQHPDLAFMDDGSVPPPGTPPEDANYPVCFRDSSEIRRPS